MQTQQEIAAQLPAHLRAFIAQQDYSIYTDRDQAVWRFLLQGLGNNLGVSAHPVYAKGLKKAGISVEHIPRIEEINDALTAMGLECRYGRWLFYRPPYLWSFKP